jgi:hypothetical protein
MQLERTGLASSTPLQVKPQGNGDKRLRRELRSLRKQFKRATEQEKTGLSELRDIIRKKLKSLATEAEERQENKRQRETAFISNPQKLSKTLLSYDKSGRLTSNKEETEEYLITAHADSKREEPLGNAHRSAQWTYLNIHSR